jgi:hypothetical protein
MNSANAYGFVAFGLLLSALPIVFPVWFPPTGLDGSSARALWMQCMGVVQMILGLGYLLRVHHWVDHVTAEHQPAASAEAGITPADLPVAVDAFSAAALATSRSLGAEPADSVTLRGSHAELWRAFNGALHADGNVRHAALHLFSLIQSASDATPGDEALSGTSEIAENVVAFNWDKGVVAAQADETELVEERAA